VMNKRIYNVYMNEPLKDYELAYSSADGELILIRKI
jgi:hypothetical protein